MRAARASFSDRPVAFRNMISNIPSKMGSFGFSSEYLNKSDRCFEVLYEAFDQFLAGELFKCIEIRAI